MNILKFLGKGKAHSGITATTGLRTASRNFSQVISNKGPETGKKQVRKGELNGF